MTAFLELGRQLKLNPISESTAVNIGFLMTSCNKVDNSVVFSHNDYSNDVSWFFRTLEAVQVEPCVISVNN